MSNNEEFTPRVVSEIPPAKTGSRGKSTYDQVFSLAVSESPEPVLAASAVPAHRAVILREALANRLERLENRPLKQRGHFVVRSRGVGTETSGERTISLVDLYVKFIADEG